MLLAMLLKHSYSDLVDELTDAAVVMAGEIGALRLSVRALAARVAITPQALLNRWKTKDRILGIVLATVADRWVTDLESTWAVQRRWHGDQTLAGLLTLLPGEAELAELPAWLSFLELARTETMYAHVAADVRSRERGLVTASLRELAGAEVSILQADVVLAVLDGLRRRLVDLEDPCSLQDAGVILASAINLTVDAAKAA